MTVDELLARLQGVRRSERGWEAHCPAHEDQRRSLTVAVGDSGALLLKCHAGNGCRVEQIVAALGLTMPDLFPRDGRQAGGTRRERRQIVAAYDYRNEQGTLLFQAVRYDPKGFTQRRPDGNGGWIYNLDGVPRVLYRLPELLAADPAATVYVVEGEKDADALAALGLVATTNAAGAGKWRAEYADALRGRGVVVLPDNDEAGRKHGAEVARSLAGIVASVRVLALPDLPRKGDVSDWLAAGGTCPKLEVLVAHAAEEDGKGARTAGDTEPASGGALPTIIAAARPLRDMSDDAIGALERRNNPPTVFVRGGRLVRVCVDERGRPVIELLGEHELRGLLTRAADFAKDGKHVSPPKDVVCDVLTVGRWPFPPLEAIVEAPVLRDDGSLLAGAGYDKRARVVYAPAPGLVVPPIPATPTHADVEAARALLVDELLGNFPFVNDASRANAIALVVTPIMRPLIDGGVPLGLLDKPQAGTGASLLADVIAIIATGRAGAMMSDPGDDEEWRKQITSALLHGATFVLIDNTVGRLRSKSLSRALTATTWKDRILGKSVSVELPQRAVWLVTGNNLRVGGDLARRSYWIRLDAKMARPYLREASEFRHALPEWAIEHRGDLLAAILTIVRRWVVAGRPTAKTPTIGGFHGWTQTIGAVLAFAGIEGFLANARDLYDQIDDDAAEWEAFVLEWFGTFGDRAVKVSEIEAEVRREASSLREALPPDLGVALESKGFAQRLGYALRARLDQVIGGLRLVKAAKDDHAKVARWRVMRVTAGNDSPDATRARGNGTGLEDYPPSPASPADTPADDSADEQVEWRSPR